MRDTIKCSKCGRGRPATDYARHRRQCPDCVRAYRKAHYKANKEGKIAEYNARTLTQRSQRTYESRLRLAYGLSVEDYDLLNRSQDGLCAICYDPPDRHRLDVDHDHASGRVRGLLCRKCNTALGSFRDDPELLRRAAEYLEDK